MKRFLLGIVLCLVAASLDAATVWQSREAVTASWTSSTAADTALTLFVGDYSTVVLTLRPTSLNGGVLTFEVSPDGTYWFPAALIRTDTQDHAEDTYNVPASVSNQGWQGNVSGYKWFRARLSTAINAGTANLQLQASAAPLSPLASMPYVDPSDGWALLNMYLSKRIRPITTK